MITLQHGDCLELMSELPDKSIDMVLCDLPYGTTQNKWDTQINLDALWAHYKRVVKDNGAICLFAQNPFAASLICSNPRHFRYEWVWRKSIATGFLNSNKMPLRAHELILVFYARLPVYNQQRRTGFHNYTNIRANEKANDRGGANYGHIRAKAKGRVNPEPYHGGSPSYGKQYVSASIVTDGTRCPIDVLEFSSHQNKMHPTAKPVPLCEYLIKTYTNAGDTVLDNCMGSGTTGVACLNTGRNFIGMELDAKYFDAASKRLGQI